MTRLQTRSDAGASASTEVGAPPCIERRSLELHPHVAVRPEPFGALAYHYDTRRLVFLKHPDVVRVVRELAHHDTVGDTLRACGIAPARHRAFVGAVTSLLDAEMLHDRAR